MSATEIPSRTAPPGTETGRPSRRRAAITGLGIVSAAGADTAAFCRAIMAGESGARPVPQLGPPTFAGPLAAIVREEDLGGQTRRRDKAFRLVTQAAAEAAAQAGFTKATMPPGSGLVLATSLGGALKGQIWHEQRLRGGKGRRADLAQASLHAVADHAARGLGLDGPRCVVSNACVSGNDALGIALDMVRAEEADLVLAGGVDTLHAFNFCGFASLGAVADGLCRPFDPSRTGMLLGEAAAFLVVESEASVRRRGAIPLAELAGYGASCDALGITNPDRSGAGASRAMAGALDDGDSRPEDVDFVSLHGVGTLFLDAMEAAAMARVFRLRTSDVPATSLRPITGHTFASASAVDAIACVLAIGGGFIPPTANHRRLDPTLPSPLRIVRELLRAPVRTVLTTSSGFGGVNAAILLRSWEPAP
jgi:3-oxoacyl-[acyl-carrier-protein] synthase II